MATRPVNFYDSKTEAQAIALAATEPGAICFTTDTKRVIVNGVAYTPGLTDNLNTSSTTTALTAKQGYMLNLMISARPTKTHVEESIDKAILKAIGGVYNFKGSVDNHLATQYIGSDNAVGDVYNTTDAMAYKGTTYPVGTNFVCIKATTESDWDFETHWQPLGMTIDLSGYATIPQLDSLNTAVDGLSTSLTSTNNALTAHKTDYTALKTKVNGMKYAASSAVGGAAISTSAEVYSLSAAKAKFNAMASNSVAFFSFYSLTIAANGYGTLSAGDCGWLFGKSETRGLSCGDIIAVVKNTLLNTAGVHAIVIPTQDAKAANGSFPGAMGLESVWDKTQVNKIPDMVDGINANASAIDKTCFRCYTGEYNANNIGWYGYYMYITLGRPAGDADETWLLRVADAGKTSEGKYIIEQTAYSAKNADKVYRRICITSDKNNFSDNSKTTFGDWEQVSGMNYAGSSSKGGAATSANKVNQSLTFTGYQAKTFNGSAAVSVAIPNNTNQLINGAGYITSGSSITGNAATASKWATARTLSLTGSVTGSVSIDGSGNVSMATTTNHTHTFSSLTSKPTTLSGYGITDAAAKSHTHSYAGSSSAGGAATSANKVNQSLTITLGSTSQGAWNGSAAKTITITPASIGASATGHTHGYASTVKVGTASYAVSGNTISLPAYPTLSGLGGVSSSTYNAKISSIESRLKALEAQLTIK